MRKKVSKSRLGIELSGLKGFHEPKIKQEQYVMDGEVGAAILWSAYLLGDIDGKIIADFGCGTGILGIGALLLGAKQVFFIDFDEKSLEIAKSNLSKLKSEDYILGNADFICQDITKLKIEAEVVLQNPPFGTKIRHNDTIFLKKALETAPIVYSFHKSESKQFLEKFSAENNIDITYIWGFKFPLKATFSFHRRRIHRIDVSCFRFCGLE